MLGICVENSNNQALASEAQLISAKLNPGTSPRPDPICISYNFVFCLHFFTIFDSNDSAYNNA